MTFEVSFATITDFRREWPCQNCGGVAHQVWLKAPGLAGVEEPSTRGVSRTFQPGKDLQSGQYFESRTDRDRWLKQRGLEALGPEEYDRSRKAAKEDPEPDYSGLIPAMKEALEESQSSGAPPFRPDVLDVNHNPLMKEN